MGWWNVKLLDYGMEIFYLSWEKVGKKFEIFLHLMCGNPAL